MKQKFNRERALPPEPTLEEPYLQIEWIFKRFIRRYKNPNTLENFKSLLSSYIRFLKQEKGYDDRLLGDPRFYLSVHWDYFAVYNAERFWRCSGLKSESIKSRVARFVRVVRSAANEDLTAVQNFFIPKTVARRETISHEPYTDEELDCIRHIISKASAYASRIAGGYVRTGMGKDPRGSKRAWTEWENMVWYFENVMECKPLTSTKGKGVTPNSGQYSFFRLGKRFHGGLKQVWDRLNVTPLRDGNLIAPLAFKLALETGLNGGSVLNLKRDCYQEVHPVTGRPFLKYYKERSKGEKELHLPLLEDELEMHLLPKQGEIIRRTVELILKLTDPLLENALPDDEDYLLLCETGQPGKTTGARSRVLRITTDMAWDWCQKVLRETTHHNQESPLKAFNLSRCRPTKITEMVLEGHDFFRIQAVAGHATWRTTAKYLSGHQFERRAQREISAKLVHIHRNAQEQKQDPKPYAAGGDNEGSRRHQEGVIYKGIICDCKNVYEPPKPVKALAAYKKGQACTYWNMCLPCPNVILTSKHLPLLVGYARAIKKSFAAGNLNRAPNAAHYEKALGVLEEIFAEYSAEELEQAAVSDACHDVHVDGVVYGGFQNEK